MSRVALLAILFHLGVLLLFYSPRDKPKPKHRAIEFTYYTVQEIAPKKPSYIDLEVLTTGYCPCEKCCGVGADGITSTGRDTRRLEYKWGIAADHRIIPPGTLISIAGYKPTRYKPHGHPWEVDDTGGDMRKAWHDKKIIHLDLRFISHKYAKNIWERRLKTKIRIWTGTLTQEQIERLEQWKNKSR